MGTPAPQWHKDAKWLTGFLSLVLCSATLLTYALYWFTAEERAVKIMSIATATAFSRNGLDDVSEFNEIRQRMRQTGQRRFQPIPGLKLYVTEEDFQAAEASPGEARIAFFRRLVEPLYRDGPAGLASLAENEEMRRQIAEGVQPFRFISKDTHQFLQTVFFSLAAATAVFLFLLVLFSHGFGRLVSPAIVLSLAALPGFVVTFFLSIPDEGKQMRVPIGEGTFASMADNVITLFKPSLKELNTTFGVIMLFSFVLLLIAGVGKAVVNIRRRDLKAKKAS